MSAPLINLVKEPFSREFETLNRFAPPFLDAEIERMKKTIASRECAVLVGPAGCGKTVVARTLRDQLSAGRYRLTYLKLSALGTRDMCRNVGLGIGLDVRGSIPGFISAFDQHFSKAYKDENQKNVIIFDDAHELRPEAFRLIRILTNFEMDSRLMLSIILVGQNSLKDKLSSPGMEDIKQRMSYYSEIRLFNSDETREYITHRLAQVGLTNMPFSEEALAVVFDITRGNMRAIDKICGTALRLAQEKKLSTVNPMEIAAARSRLLV